VHSSALDRYTDRTITDPKRLLDVLSQIRRTGVNESRGDLDKDAFSFAAAIYGREGEVVAALSVAGPVERLTDALAEDFRRRVRSTARRISEALGYRPKLVTAV
jgi:IclR family KDG regulon transcriptional repressor